MPSQRKRTTPYARPIVQVFCHQNVQVLRFHRGARIYGYCASKTTGKKLVQHLLVEGKIDDQEAAYLSQSIIRSELPERDEEVGPRLKMFCWFLGLPAVISGRPSKKDGFRDLDVALN